MFFLKIRLITESLIGQLIGQLIGPLIGLLIGPLIGKLGFGAKFRTHFSPKGELEGARRIFYGKRSTFWAQLLVTGFGHRLLLQVLVNI